MAQTGDRVPPSVSEVRAVRWVERWWQGDLGLRGRALDLLLAPAEVGYRRVVHARDAAYRTGRRPAVRVPVPVVSIGNIAVGGAGKTPVARWVVEELLDRGARPALLHGGYAADEPALHRSWHPEVPVRVGRDRVAGALAAIESGATVLVLDDGFQHRRLARDLDIALIAAETWSDRPRLLPRGPWREPPEALARAQVVAVTTKTATDAVVDHVAGEVSGFAPAADQVRIRLQPTGWRSAGRPGGGSGPSGDVVAVAGIAGPDHFVENAREAGARIGPVLVFPDHHAYSPREMHRIRDVAHGRPIVTTAKDAIKLSPLAPDIEIWVLEQSVIVEEGAAYLSRWLDRLIG